MKNLLIFFFLFFFVYGGLTFAHPGNTAADGCHYCRTNCDSRGVARNERHCHGGSSSYSAPSSSSSSYTPTRSYANCPAHSSLNSAGTCDCNLGYKPSYNNSSCVEDMDYTCSQKGMIYDTSSSACACAYGESRNSSSQTCTINDLGCKKKYGLYSEVSYGYCSCREGYTMNDAGNYCVEKDSGGGWIVFVVIAGGVFRAYRAYKNKYPKSHKDKE